MLGYIERKLYEQIPERNTQYFVLNSKRVSDNFFIVIDKVNNAFKEIIKLFNSLYEHEFYYGNTCIQWGKENALRKPSMHGTITVRVSLKLFISGNGNTTDAT